MQLPSFILCGCTDADGTERSGICVVESSGFGNPPNAEEILAATEVMAPGHMTSEDASAWWTVIIFWIRSGIQRQLTRRLKHCNLAVLTKIDLVDENQIEKVKEKVREINPVCPITESANGKY